MSEGNPNLLEGIFRDDDQASSSAYESDDSPESTADMILRATKILGSKSGFFNKWVVAENGRYFFYNEANRKLISFSPDGRYSEYIGDGKYLPVREDELSAVSQPPQAGSAAVVDDAAPVECWITLIPKEELVTVDKEAYLSTKRQRVSEDSSSSAPVIPYQELLKIIPNLLEFSEKWGLEEQSIRHLVKYDKIMVQYILESFNPTKAKPKNALLAYLEALNRYPQKWRIYAMLAKEDFEDTFSTINIDDSKRFVGENSEDGIVLEGVTECDFQISKIGNDYYVICTGSSTKVLVDGILATPADGPVGPLREGSVLVAPSATSEKEFMLLAEVGSIDSLKAKRYKKN